MARKDLAKFISGFRKFRAKYFETENSVYTELSHGQTPKNLIIGCSDSRVDPAIISDASPGDLFIVRNVANLVPPFEANGGYHGVSSAIEFAVVNLKVENIVVLGHRQCGGIRALVTGLDGGFIGRWMGMVKSAKQKVLSAQPNADTETLCALCEREAIKVSLENLRTFPFVSQAIAERQLTLIGLYFDLEAGQLFELNDSTNEFTLIV